MSISENKRAAILLGSNLLVQQAIESRARKPEESIWLAHTFEEAEANANLFAKTQLPITDPERKRNLIRAFDRVTKSRKTYYV